MTQQVRNGYRKHRRGAWGLALFLALTVAAVITIASGSAATNTKPYTADFSPASVAAGAANETITLYLANPSANQQNLGSANVTAPSGFAITNATFMPLRPASTIDLSGLPTVVKLRNLNLAPGDSLMVDITVDVPCAAGDYTWGVQAKQSNNYNGPPGNDLGPQSGNLITTVSGGCKLAWKYEPANANVNTLITDTSLMPSVDGTTVRYVTVEAQDGNGTPITSATGPVTLNMSSGSFDCVTLPAGCGNTVGFSDYTAQLVNGRAQFTSFRSDRTGTDFTFYASSPGYLPSPDNDPAFTISQNGQTCTTSGCDPFNTLLDNNTNVVSSAVGSTFTFLAVNPSSVPANVTEAGGGCQYFQSVGAAGFRETSGRTGSSGDKFFTYYIAQKLIKKPYPNAGQPFIHICAGAARVDGTGQVINCTVDGNGPWVGDALDPTTHTFNGSSANAVCDGTTGLWWGILGSFQDKWVDPNTSPSITGWSSDTTSRWFYIRVPSPWDWSMKG